MPKFKIDILVERVDRETYIVEADTIEEAKLNVLDGSYDYPDEFETVEIRSCTPDSEEELPNHEHDCDSCTFLGTTSSEDSENPLDLYLHFREDSEQWSSVIARYSSDGSDYQSMPLTVLLAAAPELPKDHPLLEALSRSQPFLTS